MYFILIWSLLTYYLALSGFYYQDHLLRLVLFGSGIHLFDKMPPGVPFLCYLSGLRSLPVQLLLIQFLGVFPLELPLVFLRRSVFWHLKFFFLGRCEFSMKSSRGSMLSTTLIVELLTRCHVTTHFFILNIVKYRTKNLRQKSSANFMMAEITIKKFLLVQETHCYVIDNMNVNRKNTWLLYVLLA